MSSNREKMTRHGAPPGASMASPPPPPPPPRTYVLN